MQRSNSGADLQICNEATLECVVLFIFEWLLGVNCPPIFVMFEWVLGCHFRVGFWVSIVSPFLSCLSGFLGVIFECVFGCHFCSPQISKIEKQTN